MPVRHEIDEARGLVVTTGVSSRRRRARRVLSLVVATGVLAASGVAGAQEVRTIRSTEPPAWGTSVQLVPEQRIGEVDGDEAYLFGRIRNVAIGRDNAVIVADDKTPILRMYDAKGKFVRNIGRAGEGPGEYRSMGGVRTLPDGRILLWDNRIQRLTYYTAAGEVMKSVRVPSGLFSADLFHVGRDGTAYVCTSTGGDSGGHWRFGWIRVSPDGRVRDTIPVPKDPSPADGFVLATMAGYDRPFTREWVSTVSSRGALLFGENERYAFEQRVPGAPTVRIERAHEPVPITGDERREWEAWKGYFSELARGRLTNDKIVQGPPPRVPSYVIPRQKPAFSQLLSDMDGRIWVRRYVAAVSRPGDERKAGDLRPRRVWREQPTYDVFEPGGRFLGTVVLPWDARFEDASGSTLWLTVIGEAGEEAVGRYRIVTGK